MTNKFKRDDAMKTWMVNPPSWDDQAGIAKGYELDGPSKEAAKEDAAVQLDGADDKAGPANQADKTFQVNIKKSH